MTTVTQNTRILLNSVPQGEPTADTFRVDVSALPTPGDGEVLLRTIYLSLDPYLRGRINGPGSHPLAVEVGTVMHGGTVSEVVESRAAGFAAGDFVLSSVGWQEYGVQPAGELTLLDPAVAPISTAVGVVGMPGWAGYSGIMEIGQPQPGETVVVAAAAGPVGSTVGQVARLKGARVVGIAGGEEKVGWVRDAGFDVALDHRSPTFAEDLAAVVPDGIDVYFENVGGAVWEAVLPLLNRKARIAVCGLVAHYNQRPEDDHSMPTAQLMSKILMKSLTVRGFTINDFTPELYAQFQREVAGWIREGKFHYREDIVDGLENAAQAFFGLLKGKSFGKLLVAVGPDPTLS